ncbi:MAG: hypothetical protein ACU0DW_12000 [Shimia sp.]
MRAEDIKTSDDLEAWIETWPEDQQRRIACAIAHRAALRVLPLAWEDSLEARGEAKLTVLPLLWAILVSEGATVGPPSETAAAAYAAAAAAAAYAYADAAANTAYAAYAAAANTAYAADAAAANTAYASAANAAAAYAAAAANTAYAADAAMLEGTRDQFEGATTPSLNGTPLWHEAANPLATRWTTLKPKIPPDWTFFIDWYEGHLSGNQLPIALIHRILEEVPVSAWQSGPDEALPLINAIYDEWKGSGGAPLADAAVADFEYAPAPGWMEMVGIPDDLIHIDDEAAKQRFQNDVEEVQEDLRDFSDAAKAQLGAQNSGAVIASQVDRLLEEFRRSNEGKSLRARRIVNLGANIHTFSLEEARREELGPGLSGMLDRSLETLRDVSRHHFGPGYEAVQALDALDLSAHPPEAWLALIDEALDRFDRGGHGLPPLSPDGRAVLKDMRDELEHLIAARGEATGTAWAAELDKRIQRETGSLGATLSRLSQRGLEVAKSRDGRFARWCDQGVAWIKRMKSADQLWELLEKIFGSGPPPGA